MILYLATGNVHKKQEMAEICKGHTIIIPSDEGIVFDPDETGLTFMENSLIKAKALWNIVKKPVLADDSGICVDILEGIPGIYSDRYRGKEYPQGYPTEKNTSLTQVEKNTLLLEHVQNEQEKGTKGTRSCHYVCSMILYFGKDRFYCVQETFEGILIHDIEESRGKGGFGYDPIVFLPELGKTVAELSEQEKNEISHRGKATKKILTLLEGNI